MKNDLITSVAVAVFGIIAAYFVCNLFIGEPEDFSFSSVDAKITADLTEPNPEVFNYRALNPTVEVYVGNCDEYNEYGECVDVSSEQIEEGVIEDNSNDDESNPDEDTEEQGNS